MAVVNYKRHKVLLIVFISLTGFVSYAQHASTGQYPDANSHLQKIREAFKEKNNRNWGKASSLWQDLVTANPYYGDFWFWLGECHYENQQPDSAIGAFSKAFYMGAESYPKPVCAYAIAQCYSRLNNKDKMYAWLQKSFDLGYRDVMAARADKTFEKYSTEKQFKQIIGLPENEKMSRTEGWQFDLVLLAREIKRKNPNPYRFITEKEFTNRVNELYEKIPSLNDVQIVIELMKIVALAGDGHTSINPFMNVPALQKNIPVLISLFEDGFYITDAHKQFEKLIGCKLLSMDNTSIEDIVTGLEPILNKDNDLGPRFLSTFRMRNTTLLHTMGLIKNPEHVLLELQDEDGKKINIDIKSDNSPTTRRLWDGLPQNWTTYFQKNHAQPPLYLSNIYLPYWFKVFEENKSVYFQLNTVGSDDKLPLDKFLDSLFNFIETGPTEKLIIDLRLNNGGNTRLTPMILEKIIACKKVNKRGKLCIIIGGRLFSATVNLVGYLQRFTQATFFGEPTRCSPNFIGEDFSFELPYSKIMANVSDRYWQSSWPDDQRQWFNPWLYVPNLFSNYTKGQDPVLSTILNYKR